MSSIGKSVSAPDQVEGKLFRDMLILLKFRARPRGTKAKIGQKLHAVRLLPRSITNLQSALGSETDSALVSKENNQKFQGGNLKVFRLNDEGTTVPAFSFEKIPAPPRTEPIAPAVDAKRRGRLARLVDRLAELRMRSEARRATRAKPRKVE